MKKFSRMVSFVLSAAVVFSVLGMNFTALAVSAKSQPAVKGNVPVISEPNSSLVFDADGNYEVILEAVPATISEEVGHEIGENLVDRDPEAFAAANQEFLDELEGLPVYPYEEYYIAHEGAVAQYDDQGELIRVRGDHEYYSTLDQYYVNGELPDGRYVGTFLEFCQITGSSAESSVMATTAAAASPVTKTGRFTTFGDYWPVIDANKWPNCNTDPVPDGPNYGDRIGTKNNKLYIGDVAVKKSTGVPYDADITVTVQASDTNGSGLISRTMRVRDTMSESANSVLDIWRWDRPEWFEGTPQRPNDLYFGQKYTTSRSFSNTSNFWTYAG